MNEKTEKEVYKVAPLKRICMTIGELPTSYLETMTYYEMLVWFIEYLRNNIIPTVNNNAEAVKELQTLYEELRVYVNEYFDNLDVQEEINNKLDAMVEAGTLQEIIADYLNSKAIFGFDNVASMISATNLIDGSYAKTLGYYSKNDGGSALYKIRTITNDDVVDDKFIIEMDDDSLIAELIIENNTVNIKQLGARSQAKDDTKYDIKNYIDSYITKQNELESSLKLYIPSGIWYTSGNQLYSKYGLHIEGDEKFSGFDTFGNGTIISTYINNQSYIFQLGNSANVCHNWVLKNICFSTANFTFTENVFKVDSVKTVTKAIELHYAEYGLSDNLFFIHIKGNAFSIGSSWENYFKLLNFRYVSNLNGSIMNFETTDPSLTNYPNITANTFDFLMFERIQGHIINLENDCRCYNSHFGIINVEPNQLDDNGAVYTSFTDENIDSFDDTNAHHLAIFNIADGGKFAENVINNIELNNYGKHYFTINSENYVYDTIVKMGENCSNANIYNNITLNGGFKQVKVIYLPSTITRVQQTTNFSTFGNFVTDIARGFMFDVNGLPGIYDNNSVLTGVNPATYREPSAQLFMNANWIPCFKTKPLRNYLNYGLGALYYDADSRNNLKLVVKPRTEDNNLERGVASSVVSVNKKFAIRAKVPNGETCRLIINDLSDDTKNQNLNCVGDGTYQIYQADLSSMTVGDKLLITVSANNTYQRNIMCDVFISS